MLLAAAACSRTALEPDLRFSDQGASGSATVPTRGGTSAGGKSGAIIGGTLGTGGGVGVGGRSVSRARSEPGARSEPAARLESVAPCRSPELLTRPARRLNKVVSLVQVATTASRRVRSCKSQPASFTCAC